MKINTFKNNLFILEANFVSEETRQGLSQVSEMFSKVLEKFSVYQICCELVAKSERARVVELVDTIDLGSTSNHQHTCIYPLN